MVDDGRTFFALAILVSASLLVILGAVVALLRSGRVPGLGATSGRAIDEVAAAVRSSRLGVERVPRGMLEGPRGLYR
jgi:ABC-type proline/glycine betaine transport system permease subunit